MSADHESRGLAYFLVDGGAAGGRRKRNVHFAPDTGTAGGADVADIKHAAVRAAASALGKCECAPGHTSVDRSNPDAVCMTPKAVAAVKRAVGTAESSAEKIVAAAKEETGCKTQACVLRKAAKSGHLAAGSLDGELGRLKVEGPANSQKLLINVVIDKSLELWREKHPNFAPVGFCMMDFDSYASALSRFDITAAYNNGSRCMGVVLNTDHHGGRGKHWVCMFCDMRGGRGTPWTVEYFNSSGRAPPQTARAWMIATRNKLAAIRGEDGETAKVKDVVVNTRAHQMQDTECGVYCLFYIWTRLSGSPHSTFAGDRVSDKDMETLREFLFIQEEK
jgi:hypothetical protein